MTKNIVNPSWERFLEVFSRIEGVLTRDLSITSRIRFSEEPCKTILFTRRVPFSRMQKGSMPC